MATAPKWAQDLVLKACLAFGKEDLPEVVWRRSSYSFRSSGITNSWTGRLVVTAGHDRLDQKLVLLHELAHWLSPAGEHHGSSFWDMAWRLYKWAKLPITYCKKREGNYRKGALVAYRRNRRVESKKEG